MTLSGKTRLFLMIVSGALTALCFAFHDVWFLCFFTLIPFFLVMLAESPCTARRFFLQVFAFAAAFYLVTLHWFYALTDFVTRSGASPFFAVLAMTGALLAAAALLALVTALVFLPFYWFRPSRPVGQALFLCFHYVAAEWLLSLMGDLAFPWARLGNFAAFSPWFIQSASLLGTLFVSLIILVVSAALALFVRRLAAVRAFDRFAAGCLVAALAVFGGNSLYGAIRLSRPTAVKNTAEVLLVQGNIIKNSKWNLPIEETLAIYFDLTEAGMTDQTRLVVWPESAVSVDLSRYPEVLAVLKNFAVARNVTFAFGTLDGEADIARPYNVLLTVTPDGAVSEPYYKRLLVPFGEFIPFESVLRFIADVFASRDVILSDTARGTEPRVFDSPVGR
ncbi:MAG: apolipoprotein N-acyltransferase, partial [Eubacteriales bacterium]|nr:apolipoprotein N-acyltransferase [Eubacteriales bacterium]